MSSEPSWIMEEEFPDLTVKVRGLVEKTLRQMKDEKISSEKDKLITENIKTNPNAQIDVEFRKNVIEMVRQRLEEENPSYLAVQDEFQEIRNTFKAFQTRTVNIIKDLQFIKGLIMEVHDRSARDFGTTKKETPSPLKSPKIFAKLYPELDSQN